MTFKEKNMYFCIHDVLLNNELAFKADNYYTCVEHNKLVGLNNKTYDLSKIKAKWEYYFRVTENKTNVTQFKGVINKMLELYEKKNADYGNSFEESCNKYGITAGLIRMNDKFNRIETLTKQENQVKNEAIEDTLIDLANYAIMTLIWYKNNKK